MITSTTTALAVSGRRRMTVCGAALLGAASLALGATAHAQELSATHAVVSSVVRVDGFRPGAVAATLAEVARAYPDLALYSYPFHANTGYAANLVVRGVSASKVERATDELTSAFKMAGVMRLAQAGE